MLHAGGVIASPSRPRWSIEILDKWYNRSYTHSMKTAISIPDKVFRSADALAKRLGISRSELYTTAVTDFLSRHQSRQVTARLDAVYGEEDSSLSPSLVRIQAKSLSHEEW
jgi:metal-responsive CopG/Arc/MetJ family transcriptional regulator